MRKIWVLSSVLFILIMFSVFGALNGEWTTMNGGFNNNPDITAYDFSFLTQLSKFYYGGHSTPEKYSAYTYNIPIVLIGNLDNDADTKEILVLDYNQTELRFGMWIFTDDLVLRFNGSNFFSADVGIEDDVILYDYNSDGIDEIVTIQYNKTTATESYFKTYIYNGNTWTLDKNTKINALIYRKTPVCEGGFCYFLDDVGRLYKYSFASSSVTSIINVGLGSDFGGVPIAMTVADCDSSTPGNELAWVSNVDIAGRYKDVSLVPLSSFNAIDVKSGFGKEVQSMMGKVLCVPMADGSGRIGVYVAYQSSSVHNWKGVAEFVANSTALETIMDNGYLFAIESGGDATISGTDIVALNNNKICLIGSRISANEAYMCFNSTGTILFSEQTYAFANYVFAYRYPAYAMDLNSDGRKEINYGGNYIVTESFTVNTLDALNEDVFPKAFESFSSPACLNYYYAINGTLYGRIDPNCLTSQGFIGGNETGNAMPAITGCTYSPSTSIQAGQTVTATCDATDAEADPIYWAYSCDYTSSTTRKVQDLFEVPSNQSAVRGLYNIPTSCNARDFNIYDAGFGYGNVFNMTSSTTDGCVDLIYRNVSGSSGLTNDFITVQTVMGWDELSGTPGIGDGIYMIGRDTSGQVMFAILKSSEATEDDSIFLATGFSGGNFNLTRITTNPTSFDDRIKVDLNLLTKKYVVRIDDDQDLDYEFVSAEYPFLYNNTNLHDIVYSVASTTAIHANSTVKEWAYSVSEAISQLYIDTVLVDTNSYPDFNILPTNSFLFACTYPTVDIANMQVWATDNQHPQDYTETLAQEIDITINTGGAGCINYTVQPCSGSCAFIDNFDYTQPISCAGWTGQQSAISPVGNKFQLTSTYASLNDLVLDSNAFTTIYSGVRDRFSVDFKFNQTSTQTIYYYFYNNDYSKVLNVFSVSSGAVFENGNLFSNMTPGAQHEINMVYDFPSQSVSYTLDGIYLLNDSFFDTGITSFKRVYSTWSNTFNNKFTMDDFHITNLLNSSNPNNQTNSGTSNTNAGYQYDPNFFCAINWNNTEVYNQSNVATHKFSVQNCRDRGYNTNANLIGLCIPRACIQDFGLAMVSWAQSNIFTTIIVVVVFILLAPLLVVLLKRR